MIRTLLSVLLLASAAGAAAQSRDALEARVAAEPGDAQARRALADRLRADGEPAAAVPHLAWLADRAPTDAGIHRELAQSLLWSDRPDEAALALAEVVALDPDDLEARVQLAEIITWSGGAARTVELLAPLADAHPGHTRLHRILAFALVATAAPEARRQLSRALALQPDDADLLVESGALERWQGDWLVARRRLRRAQRQPLTDEQAARVATLLDGVRDRSAPTLASSATRISDSNGLTRLDLPIRLDVPVSGRWGVGLELDRGGLQGIGDQSAAATAALPLVVYHPSVRTRLELAAGPAGTPGPPARLQARASAQRIWTARGFALARLTAATATAREAVDALDLGLRRTSLTAEGYAEPAATLALSATLVGARYSDANRRLQVGATARWLPLAVGRREAGLPLAALGLSTSALYEDTETVYPDARPYYTPDDLVTLSAGLAARLAAGPMRIDGTLGMARQSGGSTAAEFGLALAVERPAETLRLEIRRTGSSAYSADVLGLGLTVRL